MQSAGREREQFLSILLNPLLDFPAFLCAPKKKTSRNSFQLFSPRCLPSIVCLIAPCTRLPKNKNEKIVPFAGALRGLVVLQPRETMIFCFFMAFNCIYSCSSLYVLALKGNHLLFISLQKVRRSREWEEKKKSSNSELFFFCVCLQSTSTN